MIIDKSSPIPQYFQLQTWLKEQIHQGVFKVEDKIPTEEELVQLTGLARATVRQAIQNLTNMGYLVRKKGLGTFVTVPNISPQKQVIIGLIVPDIRSGYAPELARGAEDEAARSKHSLILCSSDDLYIKADFHANRLIENSVSGVIFVPTASSDSKNRTIVQKFQEKNIPVVLADRTIPYLDLDHVTTDNFEGAYNLTNYLIKKGHKKISFVYSNIFSTEKLRFNGYKKALEDNEIQYDPSIVVSHTGPFNEEQFSKYAQAILKQKKRITAVFAGHDRIALTFYLVARDMGLSFPEDLSIVGYDDLDFETLSLTTMHQPIYEMGIESVKLIDSRINGEKNGHQSIVLKSYLIERESVLRNK
ncbi:MAG: GntR family transcriptional regulator [Melioribacteraceae bacterium]|nr:GntR family transcriptional regulator [Melioribacteraceae bacterium]